MANNNQSLPPSYSTTPAEDGGRNANAELCPPGYTHEYIVHIPIKMADIDPEAVEDPVQPAKKGGLLKKLSSSITSSSSEGDSKMVMMTRADYLKYWAKGNDGNFSPGVQEPPGGRKEWVRKQLELNEEWKREDAAKGKPPRKIEWRLDLGSALANTTV